MKALENISLIAPCGMNCSICSAYLREKNKCPGCRLMNIEYCKKCIIRKLFYYKKEQLEILLR
jgi:uncharacterized radical SAM superfamily Fe-S cluster-containing enzyme